MVAKTPTNFQFDGLLMKDVLPKRGMWWNYGYLWKLNFLLLSAILSETTNGYDGSMLNGLQSITPWKVFFDHPAKSRLSVMSNATYFGGVVGLLTASWLCTKIGRRRPITLGSALIIIGAAIQGAAQNYAMFVIGRVFIGIGLIWCQVASPILLTELAHPSQRAVITSIYEPTWSLGSLMAAWITYGTAVYVSNWSWRIPSLLQGAMSIVQLAISLIVPESPRWLIYNNRHSEAFEILVKYHADGDRDSDLIKFEVAEIEATLELEKAQSSTSWKELIRGKGNQHRLLIVSVLGFMMQWAGNGLVSYYLALVLESIGITDSKTQLMINGFTQVWAFCSAVCASMFVETAGRRRLFFISFAGMLLSYCIWTILSALVKESNYTKPGLGYGVVALIFIFQGFYHIAGPIAPTYVMEVMSFNLRSKGAVIYQLTQTCASIFNGFTNPIALAAIGWKYYIVYCILLFAYLFIIYFFFPETKGLSLEEVSTVFDGVEGMAGQEAGNLAVPSEKKQEVVHIEMIDEP